MLGGVLILFILPFLHTGRCTRLAIYPVRQFLFWGLVRVFYMLIVVGIHKAEYPWDIAGKVLTGMYFSLIVLVPLLTGV